MGNVPKHLDSETVVKKTKKIKEGEISEEWQRPENTAKLAQKDIHARWKKKDNELHYGYKDDVKCDADIKLIIEYGVNGAAVYDSQMCTELLDSTDQALSADSA